MTKYQKIWWFTWGIFFILCLFNYVYMLFSAENIHIINIEHKFYLCILSMAAVSLAPVKFGKILLWFVLFCSLAAIHNLPEFQKITEIEACVEGKCKTVKNTNIPTITDEKNKDILKIQHSSYQAFYIHKNA